MICTEEYKEHIEYTFHAFRKVVIRNVKYCALRTWRRKYQRKISLEYLTEEKFYPFSTTDNYFSGEYPVTVCDDTVILYDKLLAAALSRLPVQERGMGYLSFFKRISQHEIGRRYGCSRSTAGYHIRKSVARLYEEMEGMKYEE